MDQSPDKKNNDNPSILGSLLKKKETNSGEKERFEYSKKMIGVDNIAKNHEEIKNIASVLLSPSEQIKNSRVENFKQAMERNGTTVAQLYVIHKNYLISFYVSIVGFLISFLYGVYIGNSGNGLLAMASCIAISLLCFANAFKFSFRCFQIKYRKLCSIKDYIDNREFIPFPLKKK